MFFAWIKKKGNDYLVPIGQKIPSLSFLKKKVRVYPEIYEQLIRKLRKKMEVLSKISKDNPPPYQRRLPQLKDLELISLALTAEFMGIDSENHLFRQIPKTIKCKIERSIYNRKNLELANNQLFTNKNHYKF